MLQTFVKHSASLRHKKILCRYNLGLYSSQMLIHHGPKSAIIHDLVNFNEDEFKKRDIDPRIEKWRYKLLFSDYFLQRSLRFGHDENRRIINLMKQKLDSMERETLMTTPVFSVTLNNDGDDKKSMEENTEEVSEELDVDSKPIYMPYAAKDSFQTVATKILKSTTKNDTLNKKFKVLYEKYLETMKTTEQTENLQKKLCVRLGDDLSKIPSNWMTDYETFNDKYEDSWEAQYGTSNPDSQVTSVPCGGCGALLHCKDSEIPGYLPSELLENQNKDVLKTLICQRCHFMKFYNTALDVKVSPEEYPELLRAIKNRGCAVILIVDLTDFPNSIWPDIGAIIGRRTPLFVVGNKIDLLPQDSPGFFNHITEYLRNEVVKIGVREQCIKHVALVSAKSGFGIETLITKIQNKWRNRGDVYLVGCTNVGKSSLFNALLQSDFCKVQAIDLIQRATTSPWPGTTLSLLKFPLTNPNKWRVFERTKRLMAQNESKRWNEKLLRHQFSVSKNFLFATLQGRIGRTFQVPIKEDEIDNFSLGTHRTVIQKKFGLDENAEEFENSKWCYDTPGSIHPDQILHLLTTDELLMTLPSRIIVPRTFVIRENQTLFLAGMGRIDFLSVPSFIRCTVFASHKLPLTICYTNDADVIYGDLLYTKAFGVPTNDPERLRLWPELVSRDMEVTGISEEESAADVVLSSAGWVSITPKADEQIFLKAWTPEGKGLFLRTPALLKNSVNLRGVRIANTPAYKKGRAIYTKRPDF
ncbi:nitric oxide-associated protein 1 [Leptopilina heterotoma]|uniref:nitric oxide-associated protein 1 n=1 Tax=Leptopilina heterotoma TaxID=63436 RepID=UPI001CA9D381|nr:nitric oxide-associated protein 1 [Leptopilina heterotoma]